MNYLKLVESVYPKPALVNSKGKYHLKQTYLLSKCALLAKDLEEFILISHPQ